eukprot:786370-Prorocentrum_lima.AAC.1
MAATPDSTEPQHPGDSCQTSSLCLGCAVSLVEWMTGNGSGVLRRDAFGSGWRRRGGRWPKLNVNSLARRDSLFQRLHKWDLP